MPDPQHGGPGGGSGKAVRRLSEVLDHIHASRRRIRRRVDHGPDDRYRVVDPRRAQQQPIAAIRGPSLALVGEAPDPGAGRAVGNDVPEAVVLFGGRGPAGNA